MPVYNTAEYLDESIGSLLNQTYKDLEIIIVDDCSTDGSYEKCLEFAKTDERIKVYRLNHVGQGLARNYGIKMAAGDWIAFIDSDDWYDLKYVEKMLNTALVNKADLVTCNICKVQHGTRMRQPMRCSEVIGIPLSKNQKLIKDMLGICTKFSKKSLWIKHKIEQPASRGEDFAVTLLLEVVAEKLVSIDDELYYYRKSRPNATSTGRTTDRTEVVTSVQCLIDGFKRNGIYEEYIELLYRHIARFLSLMLSSGSSWLNNEEYAVLKSTFLELLKNEFSHKQNYTIVHIGSFNLMRAIREMPFLQDANLSFQFSSIISIVNPITENISYNHKNKFRENMIKKDFYSDFWNKISEYDFIVMDFIEERHGIIKVGNGYVTNSDALNETELELGEEVISFGTDRWKKLWVESIEKFINRLTNAINVKQVIIVTNLLATEHGNITNVEQYDNLEYVNSVNKTLTWCYKYIEKHFADISVIGTDDCQYYFTDEMYEYGVYPWHLNDVVNEEIAEKIYKQIIKDS